LAVLGICNGFQVLTEAGMLPGALIRNAELKFTCKPVALEVAESQSAFTRKYEHGQRVSFPVANGIGNYFADEETLNRLEGEGRVVFRYAKGDNPNGSARNIAGILNEKRNVLGLMPHPERVCDPLLGGTDGRALFESLLESLS
jgi:phosphoribosylformylglycinamidine synthase